MLTLPFTDDSPRQPGIVVLYCAYAIGRAIIRRQVQNTPDPRGSSVPSVA
jgi:hypothetical protein